MSFFFFKQKTAYEMRISDWSSDVCSSDLRSRAHARAMTDVIIYHNPACGTSRNTLAMIRNAGIEPHVVEYLKTPLVRAMMVELIARAGLTPRALLRETGTPYADLPLDDATLQDDALIEAMMDIGRAWWRERVGQNV